ncbi:MAG: HEPN domain-containing protein [Candidatus Aenigmarchaeota archaeon]|nr:HEPN domain-containing protein [Candidatus Aenigmarchaeota archaeon]MDI6722339.1 HEPN domain-containing protein [Candidatus Aenigmarchaeota archaeon]
MDSKYKIYIERANNELKLAAIIFQLSETPDLQLNEFKISEPETYYSAVISHSYYAIFYCAKAYLASKGVKIGPPEEHKKAYEEFKKFVDNGVLDVELLRIYKEMIIRAEALLGIFRIEKRKRGEFTYQKLAQANIMPAKESIERARKFFSHIYNLFNGSSYP